MDISHTSAADHDTDTPRASAMDLDIETPRPPAAALPSSFLAPSVPGSSPPVPSSSTSSHSGAAGAPISGPSAPPRGHARRRLRPRRVKHSLRRVSFDLSPKSRPGRDDPLLLADPKAELEEHLKALFILEEGYEASDLEVEPPSRPGTPDSDDDEARPKYPDDQPEPAEDTPREKLPIPRESESNLSQYPKMFLEDWMDDINSLHWGPDRPNPYDRTPVPYPDGGSALVAIISRGPDGRLLPAYSRHSLFPFVSQVDKAIERELLNDGWHEGEKYVGVWMVPKAKEVKEEVKELGRTLESIDHNRPDEHRPPRDRAAAETSDGESSTAATRILPPETEFGPWVPNPRDAQDERRRQQTWGHLFQVSQTIGDKGNFTVYRYENEVVCRDKEWYQKMSPREKDLFAVPDVVWGVKHVFRLDLQPTSEDVD